MAHMRRPVLSSHHVGPRDRTQVRSSDPSPSPLCVTMTQWQSASLAYGIHGDCYFGFGMTEKVQGNKVLFGLNKEASLVSPRHLKP